MSAALDLAAAPGGDCLCGRGPALGIVSVAGDRVLFRRFDTEPGALAHGRTVDWLCVDCVADAVVRVASGEGARSREGAAR